jgi:hypothetical protein
MSRPRFDHFTAVQFLIYDVIMAGLIRLLYMLQKSSWSDRVGVRTTTTSFRHVGECYHNANPPLASGVPFILGASQWGSSRAIYCLNGPKRKSPSLLGFLNFPRFNVTPTCCRYF